MTAYRATLLHRRHDAADASSCPDGDQATKTVWESSASFDTWGNALEVATGTLIDCLPFVARSNGPHAGLLAAVKIAENDRPATLAADDEVFLPTLAGRMKAFTRAAAFLSELEPGVREISDDSEAMWQPHIVLDRDTINVGPPVSDADRAEHVAISELNNLRAVYVDIQGDWLAGIVADGNHLSGVIWERGGPQWKRLGAWRHAAKTLAKAKVGSTRIGATSDTDPLSVCLEEQ